MTSSIVLGVLSAVVAACLMEPWARVLHGRIWHGAMWGVHASHHAPRTGRFERNDVLSALHAPIAMGLVVGGCQLVPRPVGAVLIGIGVGMTLFGLAYLVVHDGLVHGRLPVGFLAKHPYFKRVRAAHLVHHAKGEAPYGLFRGPEELLALKRRGLASRRGGPSVPTRAVRAPGARGRTRSAASPTS